MNNWREVLGTIWEDRQQGSVGIWRSLAAAMAGVPPQVQPLDREELQRFVYLNLQALGHFAVVVHGLHRYFSRVPSFQQDANKAISWWRSEVERHRVEPRHFLQWQAQVSLRGKKLLLHSHSHTVLEVMEHLMREKGPEHVAIIQTHALPNGEGKIQAKALQALGFSVTMIEDAEVGKYMGICDMVLLGTDLISRQTWVNKVGTFPICAVANRLQKPVFVLADTSKCIDEAQLPEPLADRMLVMEGQHGRLFEHIPVAWVNYFVFPDKVVQGQSVESMVAQQEWHPGFLACCESFSA